MRRANRVAFKDIAKAAALAQLHEAGFDKRRRAALEQKFDDLAGADEDNVQDHNHIRKLQEAKRGERVLDEPDEWPRGTGNAG